MQKYERELLPLNVQTHMNEYTDNYKVYGSSATCIDTLLRDLPRKHRKFIQKQLDCCFLCITSNYWHYNLERPLKGIISKQCFFFKLTLVGLERFIIMSSLWKNKDLNLKSKCPCKYVSISSQDCNSSIGAQSKVDRASQSIKTASPVA